MSQESHHNFWQIYLLCLTHTTNVIAYMLTDIMNWTVSLL